MSTDSPSRGAISTWYFVVVVVRKADKYLLVHERKHGQTWYLPAGRVEPGETLPDAALRETEEETGIPIALDGLIRVEHRLIPDGARVRVIFSGHAVDDRPPKSTPDAHSLEARWVTLDEAAELPLRGDDVLHWLKHAATGQPIYPTTVLGDES